MGNGPQSPGNHYILGSVDLREHPLSAYMVFEPETGLGVVMLRNYNQGQTNLGEASRELLIELLDLLEHE